MTLFKYVVFNKIVELGSLTKAAEALNVTQSGISHGISSLESEFGFSLLTRDRSGVNLTSNGEYILQYVREVLLRNAQLKEMVGAINGLEVGTVRIGTFTTVSTQWLPKIMKQFQNQHSSIEIKLFEGNYDDINGWITSNTTDFGFVSLPAANSFDTIPLTKDRMLCILPDNHPLSQQDTISFVQIEQESFIMPKWGNDHDVRRILKENKVNPTIKYEVAEDQAIIAMVQNGLGISILPEMVLSGIPSNIRIINLEKDHYRMIGIATASAATIAPAARRFMDYIRIWLGEQNLLDF